MKLRLTVEAYLKWAAVLQSIAALSLVGSVLWFVVTTWRWPLTGDAALMHYVVFLMEHGWRPYRDIFDT